MVSRSEGLRGPGSSLAPAAWELRDLGALLEPCRSSVFRDLEWGLPHGAAEEVKEGHEPAFPTHS